ncbi:uncharacterized protein [Antedon mediterranea]|uniref:uncharacterized protein n=1 Tax=Antedon mediterranea TaxID=105859 RepID=UPI003AF708A7
MMGTPEDPGVNIISIRELLKMCNERSKISYTLKVQELRGNIQVFCPLRFDQRTENCHKFPSDQDIVCNNAAGIFGGSINHNIITTFASWHTVKPNRSWKNIHNDGNTRRSWREYHIHQRALENV